MVESALRPDYSSYVTLSTGGIKGEIYGNPSARKQIDQREQMLHNLEKNTPFYGQELNANIRSSGTCGINAYEKAMAQEAQSMRAAVATENYSRANAYRQAAGNY